jgi:hypothetical protein
MHDYPTSSKHNVALFGDTHSVDHRALWATADTPRPSTPGAGGVKASKD